MNDFENPNTAKRKNMPCGYAEKTLDELEKVGWVQEWSFHTSVPEQWNDACERVKVLQCNGDWEVTLVRGQTQTEIMDGVMYIVKKTKQRKQWDNEHGYK
ncbi:MAG: hypothetical protein AAB503_01360 [Patescibacteria group bacterium]